MKEFVLDYSKWRCGDDGFRTKNVLGIGPTKLLNNEGFMCCLGQFMLQEGFTEDQIRNFATPCQVGPGSILTEYEDIHSLNIGNTKMASAAMEFNDNHVTTPQEKIELLTDLFRQNGIEMKVINQPPLN